MKQTRAQLIYQDMLRGKKMKGKMGDISFDSAEKKHEQIVKKHILIEHPNQTDKLLYKLNRSTRYDQETKELSMLKSHKPTEDKKNKDFLSQHKKVFSYIDDLRNNIDKPISPNLKKQHMFTEKNQEFMLRRMASEDTERI